MKEAREIIRKIIREIINERKKKRKHPRFRPPRKDPKTGKEDDPCGPGFSPGAVSGVKTKIGPQSGRRVSNCEPDHAERKRSKKRKKSKN